MSEVVSVNAGQVEEQVIPSDLEVFNVLNLVTGEQLVGVPVLVSFETGVVFTTGQVVPLQE